MSTEHDLKNDNNNALANIGMQNMYSTAIRGLYPELTKHNHESLRPINERQRNIKCRRTLTYNMPSCKL